jgi:uncharacterized membrane-anchored protein
MKRKLLILAGLLIALVVVNSIVLRYEGLLRSGRVVMLELAPVDPRSLMQGDYMRLQFAVAREAASSLQVQDADSGFVVVQVGDKGIARFARVQSDASVDAPGELAIRYRRKHGQIFLGSDAYFFEEGRAGHFEQARYGELRVGADGTALLTTLRDANLAAL